MYLYLKCLGSTNVSVTGDKGKPSIDIAKGHTETALVKDAVGNVVFCDVCASLITKAHLEVRVGSATGRILTAAEMEAVKDGSLFDLDEDGMVDEAEHLTGVEFTIDLVDGATEWSAVLPGDGSKRFIPKRAIVLCTMDDTLAANATLSIGTAPAGTQYLNGAALTGLNAANKAIEKVIDATTTAIAAVADNATLYCRLASADTGTAGTAKVVVEGTFVG
jgi:hypothetical protein